MRYELALLIWSHRHISLSPYTFLFWDQSSQIACSFCVFIHYRNVVTTLFTGPSSWSATVKQARRNGSNRFTEISRDTVSFEGLPEPYSSVNDYFSFSFFNSLSAVVIHKQGLFPEVYACSLKATSFCESLSFWGLTCFYSFLFFTEMLDM